jgi:hypothetical protein
MNTTSLFTVRYVSDDTLPDSNVRIVGITEDPQDASARCFLFQRSIDSTTENQRLGTYCISNEQGWTDYDPLDSYHLDQEALILNFTAEAAAMFGYPRTLRLELALNKHDVEVLDSGLRAIVGVL